MPFMLKEIFSPTSLWVFSSGTGDMSPDDPEEHVPTVQDSEINLLNSGDVT